MKKILVPTDFSECAFNALKYAAMLAKKTKAAIYLINIIEIPDYFYTSSTIIAQPTILYSEYLDKHKAISKERLKNLAEEEFLAKINTKTLIKTARNIYSTILEYSNTISADIIVMGTKGSGGIKGILLGSNAERTVRFSERPVIVVSGETSDADIKKITFASDFNEEALNIYPILKNFAKIYNSEIYLLKVNIPEQFNTTRENTDLMNNFNKYVKANHEIAIYDDYMKETGILNFADNINADLIAIGTHGKTGLARFFTSDISEGIVRLSSKPILVINFKNNKHKGSLFLNGKKNKSFKNTKKRKTEYSDDYFDY